MVVATAAQPAQPNRTCALDMGSNTFRRIVASFDRGRYTPISQDKKALGVGDDVTRNGRVSDAKLAEIDATLREFKAACVKDGLPQVVAVGTAAFRDAANGRRVVEIASQHQIDMEIATAERESALAYLVGSLGADGLAVIDNGSRTIELVAQQGGVRQHSVSNLGYRVACTNSSSRQPKRHQPPLLDSGNCLKRRPPGRRSCADGKSSSASSSAT